MHDLDTVHDGQVTSVEFSKDGSYVLTASRDNTVAIVDIRTYQVVRKLEGSSRAPFRNLINWNRAVWSPDDKHVMVGGHAGELFFWNTDTGKLEAILPGVSLSDGIYGAAAAPSPANAAASAGSSAAAASPTTRPASSSSAAAVAAANTVGEQAISCVDWNRNGRQVLSCDQGGNVHVFEDEIKK